MNIPDLVNGGFEFVGGLAGWVNVFTVYKDKQVRGVNIWATLFFNFWGFWNLWYYPHLGQWASFWGGLALVSANTAWVWLAFKYRRPPGPCGTCLGIGTVPDLANRIILCPACRQGKD